MLSPLKGILRVVLSRRVLCLALLGLSLSHFSEAGWIQVKAKLAQQLLDDAWRQTIKTQLPVKAWPWADTWPVARLQFEDKNIDWLVLAGAHGEALAFGPGHLSGSAKPGYAGSSVIAGHRDTHFAFLQELSLGEQLVLVNDQGLEQAFAVTAIEIVDSEQTPLWVDPDLDQLLLVTCYPFDAMSHRGSLRYVVTAELAVNSTASMAIAKPFEPVSYHL